jgi:hypothetical protein
LWGRRLDTQAFSASGADVDGVEFAALDTLHDGLAGHAVGEGGLEHRQPAVGASSTNRLRMSSVRRMRQGAPGVRSDSDPNVAIDCSSSTAD